MKIGLFFGSFNPIHNGHLIIANYILEYSDIEQLWFVISPQNPLKKKSGLLQDYHRYNLLDSAIGISNKYKVCDIEFKMPKPSYTIDTLTYLNEKYPDKEFVVIMGSDNLKSLPKWKNYIQIIHNYEIIVYPRPDFDCSEYLENKKIKILKAPLMEISSTFIRDSIKNKKDLRFFMPENVYNLIKDMHFYEK